MKKKLPEVLLKVRIHKLKFGESIILKPGDKIKITFKQEVECQNLRKKY